MPFTPDQPTSVFIGPNGTGDGNSVRYEFDRHGVLAQISSSATGEGTHMKFFYNIPGFAEAQQNLANGTQATAPTPATGVLVGAQGIQGIDVPIVSRPQEDTAMDYRDENAGGLSAPLNYSSVTPLPAHPHRADTETNTNPHGLLRSPAKIYDTPSFGAVGHDNGNGRPSAHQASRMPASHQRPENIEAARLAAEAKWEAEQLRARRLNALAMLRDVRRREFELERQRRLSLGIDVSNMVFVDVPESMERPVVIGMPGSDDVGDLYVNSVDGDAMNADDMQPSPEPPRAPTAAQFGGITSQPELLRPTSSRYAENYIRRTPSEIPSTPSSYVSTIYAGSPTPGPSRHVHFPEEPVQPFAGLPPKQIAPGPRGLSGLPTEVIELDGRGRPTGYTYANIPPLEVEDSQSTVSTEIEHVGPIFVDNSRDPNVFARAREHERAEARATRLNAEQAQRAMHMPYAATSQGLGHGLHRTESSKENVNPRLWAERRGPIPATPFNSEAATLSTHPTESSRGAVEQLIFNDSPMAGPSSRTSIVAPAPAQGTMIACVAAAQMITRARARALAPTAAENAVPTSRIVKGKGKERA